MRRRAVKLAVVLPPLAAVAVYGYWRFLSSDAFRVLLEEALGAALEADVSIGSHEIESPARIALSDLSIAFRAGGAPSGIRFRTKDAQVRAGRLLGSGPFEEVVFRDVEAGFNCPASRLARLDFLSAPPGKARVRRASLTGMAVSFVSGGTRYRVGGIDTAIDFSGAAPDSGGNVRVEVNLVLSEIEGAGGFLAELLRVEAPRVKLTAELTGAPAASGGPAEKPPEKPPEKPSEKPSEGPTGTAQKLSITLQVESRTGWKLGGEVEADLSRSPAELMGALDLWDLPINRVFTPPPGITVSAKANTDRRIDFTGPLDRLRVEVSINVKGLDFADENLGLAAKGVTLSRLRKARSFDMLKMLRGLLEEEGAAGAGVVEPGGGP